MEKFEIYCNYDFLIEFFDKISIPISDFNLEKSADLKYILDFYNLIQNHSNLIIDKNIFEIIKDSKNNPFVKSLLKKGKELIDLSDSFNNIFEDETFFNNQTNTFFC